MIDTMEPLQREEQAAEQLRALEEFDNVVLDKPAQEFLTMAVIATAEVVEDTDPEDLTSVVRGVSALLVDLGYQSPESEAPEYYVDFIATATNDFTQNTHATQYRQPDIDRVNQELSIRRGEQ